MGVVERERERERERDRKTQTEKEREIERKDILFRKINLDIFCVET